ncbi:hypothetical protein [Microbulbifer thermotolerans]|uniref:hypothetical protein n=1 Tax=Microbulbifer thermotolerans TaxID=252514 RepID=UPI00224A9A77|nr:hypothetical protein [Microbulbifer thermotolerans]MCX2834445.1 hypothetical protein [Microbulbifer thermotolerans]
MRLHKRLSVAGEALPLVAEDVRLDLFSPGRAAFTVQSTKALTGLVQLDLGYQLDKLQRFFLGYVVRSEAVGSERQKIFARELTAALARRLPLALRYVSLPEVLKAVAQQTGLTFITGRDTYTTVKAPVFYSPGTGYWALDSLGSVYQVPKFIWQQQGDGRVFVGSWEESFWNGRPLELPAGWQKEHGVAGRAKIPCIPRLRPGVLLNGNYLIKVGLSGNFMELTWSADPWTKLSRV